MGRFLHPDMFEVQGNTVCWNDHTVQFMKEVTLPELANDYLKYQDGTYLLNKENLFRIRDNAKKLEDLLGEYAPSFAEIYSNDLNIFDTIGNALAEHGFSMDDNTYCINNLREELSQYSKETIDNLFYSVELYVIDRHFPGCLPDSDPFCVYGSENDLREAIKNEVNLLYDEDERQNTLLLNEVDRAQDITFGFDLTLPDETILSVEPMLAYELINNMEIDIYPTKDDTDSDKSRSYSSTSPSL